MPDLPWNASLPHKISYFFWGTEDKESKADYPLIPLDWHIQNLCFVALESPVFSSMIYGFFLFWWQASRTIPDHVWRLLKTKEKCARGCHTQSDRQQSIKADHSSSYNNEKCDQIWGGHGQVLQVKSGLKLAVREYMNMNYRMI